MIVNDGIKVARNSLLKVIDYFFSSFKTLGVMMLLIGLWQVGSESFGEFLLPTPLAVSKKAIEILTSNQNDILISLYRGSIGIGVAFMLGIGLGLVAGSFKSFAAFMQPLNTILLSISPIIWVVFALFWFSLGNVSTIFTIIITTTPLTFASAMIAMQSLKTELKELFDAYKLGFWLKIRYLYLPHLTGYIIGSLSVAFAMGVKIVVMAELLGASDGIGARIADARTMLDTTEVMAYVMLTITFVMLFEAIVITPLKIVLMPWKR